MFYCPTSVQRDLRANKAFVKTPEGHTVSSWETGVVSYIYLAGIEHEFPDPAGKPTFIPAMEAPHLARKKRTVLLGDRTVTLNPGPGSSPGSNHEREGGWFYYTSGDTLWLPWNRLAAHPSRACDWYWPRTAGE